MTPADHAATVRQMLPSMEGHEDNCPCGVGQAHAALDALQAQAEADESTAEIVVAENEQLRKDNQLFRDETLSALKRAEAAEADKARLNIELDRSQYALQDEVNQRVAAEAERDRLREELARKVSDEMVESNTFWDDKYTALEADNTRLRGALREIGYCDPLAPGQVLILRDIARAALTEDTT